MTLIELKKGGRPLYRVRWDYRDRSIDGRPYFERDFRSEAAAKAWHKKVTKAPGTKKKVQTVAQIVRHVLDTHVASECDQSTHKDYEVCIRLRIIPGLGSIIADRLTPEQVTAFRSQMLNDGFVAASTKGKRIVARPVSVPTVNKTLRVAKALIRVARAEGLTSCMAFEGVRSLRDKRPRAVRRSKPYAYTDAEIDRLVAACETTMDATVIVFGKDTGLRRGELFALHWEDIDIPNGLVHVRHALNPDGTLKEPKTHERRTVPIFADGLAAITRWRERSTSTGLVFHTVDGRPLNDTWESGHAGKYATRRPTKKRGTRGGEEVRVLGDGIRRRSGIHLELGHLRDTYAHTLLIVVGASDAEVTLAMGHESVETTRRHYLEWLEEDRQALRKRGDALIAARRKDAPRSSPGPVDTARCRLSQVSPRS